MAADPAPPTPPVAPAPKPDDWRGTLRFMLVLALGVFVLRSFLFSPFNIPSESMLPRLFIGDYLFVSKWNYGYSRWSLPGGIPLIPGRVLAHDPARGDIVVFRAPGEDHEVVKRVIGLPGDTIQMRAGQLILDGVPVPKLRIADFVLPLSPNYDARQCAAANRGEDAQGHAVCRYLQYRETLPGGVSYAVLDRGYFPEADDTGVYTVPAGTVFVMGDNRDDSADSRFAPPAGMGYVPMDHLEGRALFIFWSTDGSANWLLPWTWVSALRPARMGRGF